MDTFENKTAFVTGAASGIGFATTQALAREGAQVMMADIDEAKLEEAAAKIRSENGKVETVLCNVLKLEDVEAAAKATQDAFGNVHMVMNNAGVALSGVAGEIPMEDWRWIVDVNLMGVVHGVETFVPMMRAHGEGGYFVNTASMAGHVGMPTMGPYNATKFAVVGYSEAIQQELLEDNIGVSVLCPGWVKTNIYNTGKLRPTEGQSPAMEEDPTFALAKALVDNGMEPDRLARLILKSMQARRLYIFNDAEMKDGLVLRNHRLMSEYEDCLRDLEDC